MTRLTIDIKIKHNGELCIGMNCKQSKDCNDEMKIATAIRDHVVECFTKSQLASQGLYPIPGQYNKG